MSLTATKVNKKISNSDEKKEKDRLLGEIVVQTSELNSKMKAVGDVEDFRREIENLNKKKINAAIELDSLAKQQDDSKYLVSLAVEKIKSLEEEYTIKNTALELDHQKLMSRIKQAYTLLEKVNISIKEGEKKIETLEKEFSLTTKELNSTIEQKNKVLVAIEEKENRLENSIVVIEKNKIEKTTELDKIISSVKNASKELNIILDERTTAQNETLKTRKENEDLKSEQNKIKQEILKEIEAKNEVFFSREEVLNKKEEDLKWREKNLSSKISSLKSVKQELEKIHGKKLNHIVID